MEPTPDEEAVDSLVLTVVCEELDPVGLGTTRRVVVVCDLEELSDCLFLLNNEHEGIVAIIRATTAAESIL